MGPSMIESSDGQSVDDRNQMDGEWLELPRS